MPAHPALAWMVDYAFQTISEDLPVNVLQDTVVNDVKIVR